MGKCYGKSTREESSVVNVSKHAEETVTGTSAVKHTTEDSRGTHVNKFTEKESVNPSASILTEEGSCEASGRKFIEDNATEASGIKFAEDDSTEANGRKLTEDDSTEANGRKLTEADSTEASGRKLTEDDSTEANGRKLTEADSTEANGRKLTEDDSTEDNGRKLTEDDSIEASGKKLIEEETRRQLDAKLRSDEILYQQTRVLRQEMLHDRPGSAERMARHIDRMCSSFWAYEDEQYDFVLGQEFQKLAGEGLVASGSVPVLCDIVIGGLTGKQALACYEDALNILLNFALWNPTVCEAIESQGRLLPAVVDKLGQLCHPDQDGNMLMVDEDLAESCLGLLNNIARTDGSVQHVQQLPAVFEVIGRFLNTDGYTKMLAIKVLACIATDEEAEKLIATSDVILFGLKHLQAAEDSGNHYVDIDINRIYVSSFVRDVKYLARNDVNSRQLVKEGVLPLLKNGLESHSKDERKECMEALWWLSFNKENRMKICEDDLLVDLVVHIYRSPSDPCMAAAEGVLFQLRHYIAHSANPAIRSVAEQLHKQEPSSTSRTSCGHVMLSYQTSNRPVVKMVCDFLKNHGVAVWMDIYHMAEGHSSTAQTMAEAVENSSVFLMGVSESYKNSQYCRSEAEYAYENRKRIIPLRLQSGYKPDGWLGFIQGSKFFYDLSRQDTYAERLQQLLSAVLKVVSATTQVGQDTVQLPTTAEGPKKRDQDRPSDFVAQTEGSHGQLMMTATPAQSTSGLSASASNTIRKWTAEDVHEWLVKFDLTGEKVQAITGIEIAYFLQMKSEASETYHQLLMSYFQQDVSNMAKLSLALEGVQSML